MTKTKVAATPTPDEIWADDRLGRREDAAFLSTFLRNRSQELAEQGEQRSYVLNLDAEWGQGKTFFLERMREELDAAGHLAVYVNAWRDDFADDPLVAVMAAIDEEVKHHIKPRSGAAKAWEVAKSSGGKIAVLAGKGLVRRGLSLLITSGATEAIDVAMAEAGDVSKERAEGAADAVAQETVEAIEKVMDRRAEEAVSTFAATKASIEAFRKNLAEFVVQLEKDKGKAAPMFVLVDELDRCRPPYAIAMLERIKHLFETPNVGFIVATDSGQLVHSIRAVYGQEFAGGRYLKRFFDRTFLFEKPATEDFVADLFQRFPLPAGKLSAPFEDDYFSFTASFFYHAGTNPRSIRQVYDVLRTIATAWEHPVRLQLAILLPLIAAFHDDGLDEDALRDGEFIPPLLNWKLAGQTWEGNERIRRQGRHHLFEVRSIARELWVVFSQQDLRAALESRRKVGDSHQQWLRQALAEEVKARFDGKASLGDGSHRSIVLDYPRLVRQAGRLSNLEV